MPGMQMTGMDEERGYGSAAGRSSTNDEVGATKTCPRCGAVLFSDMNRCYGCLYDFPEQGPKANPMTLDEPWENVDEPWGSLDGLWAEGEATGGETPQSVDKRDAALEESVGMPDVAPGVEEGAEGEPRAGVSESPGAQSPSGAASAAPFARQVSPRTVSPAGVASPVSENPASPASVAPASPAPSHVVVPSISDTAQKPVAFVRGVPCVRIQTPVSTVVVEVDGSNVTIRQEPLVDAERRPKAYG